MRRILKWLSILLAVLVVGGFVFVVAVLGVNPFEGKVEALWDVVSYQVHFYVHGPGTRLLEEAARDDGGGVLFAEGGSHAPIARFLARRAGEPGFEMLDDLRVSLREEDRAVAEDLNPRIPLGLVTVDPLRDFFGSETAFAGTITDYTRPRLTNFVVATRIPFYARFTSALKQGFIRSRLPGAYGIELEKGSYFSLRLPPEAVEAFRPYRTERLDPQEENLLYLARIKDTLVLSDNSDWIEDAIDRGSGQALRNSNYFERSFMWRSQRGRGVELYVTEWAAQKAASIHVRPSPDGAPTPLAPLAAILPVRAVGDMMVRLDAEADALHLELVSTPSNAASAFKRIPDDYIHRLYNQEPAPIHYLLGAEGLARYIPKERTAGAAVFEAGPEILVPLLIKLMPPDTKELATDVVRQKGGSRFRSVEDVLREVSKDLSRTHLAIFHRPSAFDRVDTSVYTDDPELSRAELGVTFVLEVKDTVSADKVVRAFTNHLHLLGIEKVAVQEGDPLRYGRLEAAPENMALFTRLAYGPLPGDAKYVLLSTLTEGARAVYQAAQRPETRLLEDEQLQLLVSHLPARGTLGILLNAEVFKQHLEDNVWDHAWRAMDAYEWSLEWAEDEKKRSGKTPSDEEIAAARERYKYSTYRQIREEYLGSLAWLDSLRFFAAGIALGTDEISAKAVLLFRPPEVEG